MATKYKDCVEVFPTLREFYNTIEKREFNKVFVKDNRCSSIKCSERTTEFAGTKSYEEASNLLLNGDKKNCDKIRESLKKINTTNRKLKTSKELKTTFENDVCGVLPVIPAYLAGTPNNMLKPVTKLVKSNILNVVLDFGYGAGTTAEEILQTSTKIASAIGSIEKSGYRINLYICHSTKVISGKNKQFLFSYIKLKDASSPLNLLTLSYPLVHPSFYRRHSFKWIETLPVELYNSITFCHGYCASSQEVRQNITETFNKDTKCILCRNYICKEIDVIINDILK